jgi:hypothetical protein
MRRLAIFLGAAVLLSIAVGAQAELVPPGRPAPELASGAWINSQPLTMQALRGRVVLIDFWTFG